MALSLDDAIRVTGEVGFPAIELACRWPHLDLQTALSATDQIADSIRRAGLEVSALSLYNSFTLRETLDEQCAAALRFIFLAPEFGTGVVKLTPGAPGSVEATEENWRCLGEALDRLVPAAEQVGVRLAFETHMRQLTDTVGSAARLLNMAKSDTVGLTVDFSNLAFAGDDPVRAVEIVGPRIYNTHIKNGYVGANGEWHFQAIDRGLTDYAAVLPALQAAGYHGYLTIECLGPDAKERPADAARRDLAILEDYCAMLDIAAVTGGVS